MNIDNQSKAPDDFYFGSLPILARPSLIRLEAQGTQLNKEKNLLFMQKNGSSSMSTLLPLIANEENKESEQGKTAILNTERQYRNEVMERNRYGDTYRTNKWNRNNSR